MNALDIITAAAGVATALAAGVAAFQLRETRQQRQSEFELRFSDRYDEVVSRIPLGMLLGEQPYNSAFRDPRRAFYDYFELCEQECYYRSNNKIDDGTWDDWAKGIRDNHGKMSFREAWRDISAAAPDQFDSFRNHFPEWT